MPNQSLRSIANFEYSHVPIAKLPNELLIEVFILVLGDSLGEAYHRDLEGLMRVPWKRSSWLGFSGGLGGSHCRSSF